MSTTIIYHRADPDGWFSNTICRKFLPPDTVSIGWDYGDPTPEIPKEGYIYMVDISVADIMNAAATNAALRRRLIWIDHHKTAIAQWDALDLNGTREDGVAACRLCWAYFIPDKASRPHDWSERQPGEPLAVFLVGLRDVWKHEGTPHENQCNWLNLALAAKRDDEELRHALITDEHWEDLHAFFIEGIAIESYTKSSAKEHCARGAMIVKWKGLRFAVLNSQSKGSKVLDAWAKENPVDALFAWAVESDSAVGVSLYHAPGHKDIDLSIIAKEYGGGGHAGACGFRTTLEHIVGIIKPAI